MSVSVIMPCHNAALWIAEALRSIAAQSPPPHEIIVVDDASTDDSVAVIRSTGIDVQLISVNVRNAAAARNIGIEAATGDWIALLDADDVWYPGHLERAASLLNGTENVAFMSNHDWINLEGAVIPIPDGLICKLSEPHSGFSVDDFYHIAEKGLHFGHSTVLYRRQRVIEVGLFDVLQKRRHDIDLWLRVIAGHNWMYDTVKGAGYREAVPGSISKNALECDYYYLRALIKNAARVESPLLRKYTTRQARRAMGIAFADAPAEHYARIRELAWPHLPRTFRFFYACGSIFPGLLRRLIKIKRRAAIGREAFRKH